MDQHTLARSGTRFALRLMAELRKQQPQQNVFISPLSIMLALAMTANGAQGETLRGMLDALDLRGASLDDLNTGAVELLALARTDPQVQLSIANSLWGNREVAFREDFLARCRTVYGAEVSALDFGAPASLDRINGWVAQQTQDKIPTIIAQLNPADVLVLLNAIFFKGVWKTQFDPKLTRPFPFNLPGGVKKPHPLMNQSGKFDYAEYNTFEAIRLPYGAGDVNMYVLLPARASHPADLLATLDAQGWDTAIDGLRKREGMIALPRFTLEYAADLNKMLVALGMGDAFDPGRADFGGMMPDAHGHGLAISLVRHKTFLEVNEEGTTAAAATAVMMTRSMSVGPRHPPFTMIVDRPFCCAIRDDRNGALLFLGAIMDPTV
ncbi:MAG TPA: serpin family protein [Roseiflexaceae bacterium]|nr:serpin family protein [Roseiflexaceae bacterium]